MWKIALSALSVASALALSQVSRAETDGVCIADIWVAGTGETRGEGPDFEVYHLRTPPGLVSIYVGCCSEVSSNARTAFMRVDGTRVWRTMGKQGFSGYLIEHRHGDRPSGQLHFFGDGLKGDDRDRLFFANVHAGKIAAAHCTGKRHQ